MKHTPGPWTATFEEIGIFRITATDSGGKMFVPYGRNGQADACLIAAAPDLLDSLEMLRECLKNRDDHDSQARLNLAIRLSGQAVAKARGEK